MCPSFHAGAVDELGDMPYYAEHCAAMLAVTYSSGQGMQRNIVSGFILSYIKPHVLTYTDAQCIDSVYLCDVWCGSRFLEEGGLTASSSRKF